MNENARGYDTYDRYDGFDRYGKYNRHTVKRKEKIVYDRPCKNCKCRKDGLDTVCEAYKCIPQSVQRGGTCEKHIEDK